MSSQVSHENVVVINAYWDDYLFSRRSFRSHLDVGFWFQVALDDVIDLVDFLCIKSRKRFFDSEHLKSVRILL